MKLAQPQIKLVHVPEQKPVNSNLYKMYDQ